MTEFDSISMNPSSTHILWQGASSDLANMATGGRVTTASYKLTEDAIQFASGVVSSREEIVPLWAVRDVDYAQSMTQRARGVADLTLNLDSAAGVYGQTVLQLKSIREAKTVRDQILQQANIVRQYWNQRRHELDVERQRASASQVFVPSPAVASPANGDADLMTQLTKLGELKSAGLLTDDEFASAKAKLLG